MHWSEERIHLLFRFTWKISLYFSCHTTNFLLSSCRRLFEANKYLLINICVFTSESKSFALAGLKISSFIFLPFETFAFRCRNELFIYSFCLHIDSSELGKTDEVNYDSEDRKHCTFAFWRACQVKLVTKQIKWLRLKGEGSNKVLFDCHKL